MDIARYASSKPMTSRPIEKCEIHQQLCTVRIEERDHNIGRRIEKRRGESISHEESYINSCATQYPFVLCHMQFLMRLLELRGCLPDFRALFESHGMPHLSGDIVSEYDHLLSSAMISCYHL
jgi:hypothetical protein